MTQDHAFWLNKLAKLRIDRASGDPAPHKPFLLLVVIEMAEKGEIIGDELALSADLAYRFGLFNTVIADRKRPALELRMPFHHLKSSGIWQPLMADGTPSPHRSLTARVRLDASFLACLHDPDFREQAKQVLIETEPYFRPDERHSLYALFAVTPASPEQVKKRSDRFKTLVARGREARFRVDVVVIAYKHTCALTGYRMTTVSMESIVDAAHIHEFCDSRNNDPQNGLALCKNAHWQFDQGLWTVDDDYRVRVNCDRFNESGAASLQLAGLEGHRLHLPVDSQFWPKREYLEWHRRHRFKA